MAWLERLRKIVQKEIGPPVQRHPPVSPVEDRLARALKKSRISHERQVKIQLGRASQEAGVGYYTLDFLVEGKLVVEVDSWSHRHLKREWDLKRDKILRNLGYAVMHLPNERVIKEPNRCAREVKRRLLSLR
jgi:very-short-patch-repair endonuclease